MRHLVTILIALFIGAYSNCNAQSRAEKKAQKIAVVKEKLDSGNFRIDITHIMPATQPMTTAHTTYYLEFQKDTFSCHLPYIGTSTSAIYGAQDLSIRSEKQKLSGLEKGYDAKQEYTGYIFEFINTNLNERWKCYG